MARTLYPAQVAQNYSEAKWSLADDNAQDQTKPVAGDTIVMTTNSGKVTCDETWAAAGISHPGAGTSEWDFGAQTGVVSGDITLDKIVATAAACDITATNFDVGTDGSITFSDDGKITADVEIDGGTIADGGNNLEIAGSYVYSSGTVTSTGEWTLSGTGNLANSSSGDKIAELVISGTMTLTDNVAVSSKVTVTGTATTATSKVIIIFTAASGWWGAQTGTVSCGLRVVNSGNSPGNDITLTNADLWLYTFSAHTMTLDANVDIGTGQLWIYGTGAGDLMTVTVSNKNLTCGAILLGATSAVTGSGVLNLGDSVIKMASLDDGNAANGSNALGLGSAYIELSGTMTGTNITVTADDGTCHIEGGTITDVDADNAVYAHNSTDGGGNTNINIDTNAPPCSLMSMGMGV